MTQTRRSGFKGQSRLSHHRLRALAAARVRFNGAIVADKAPTRSLLFRDSGILLRSLLSAKPTCAWILLAPTAHQTFCPYKGDASYWTVTVGDKTAENAVWSYRDPFDEVVAIKDYVAFYWNKMDAWYEEDDEIFVHPRDPYKRIDVVNSSRPVRVVLGGETVADTKRARFLFETRLPTRYYIPIDDDAPRSAGCRARRSPPVPTRGRRITTRSGSATAVFRISSGPIAIRSPNARRSKDYLWFL